MNRSALAGLLLGVLGCSSPFASSGDVHIRIGNESSTAFSRVEVVFPQDEVDYGLVQARGVSEYRRVAVAYAYAPIDVQIGDTHLRIQPIDYVGESELRAGHYTYALNVVGSSLTLELRKDR